MMGLVQSKMVWSSLATVRAVAAELRPVTGKTGCAGDSGQYQRREQVEEERKTNAVTMT